MTTVVLKEALPEEQDQPWQDGKRETEEEGGGEGGEDGEDGEEKPPGCCSHLDQMFSA